MDDSPAEEHVLFYYGHYANAVKGRRLIHRHKDEVAEETGPNPDDEPTLRPARRAALRRWWADWIRRVFEGDPLVCDRCGGRVRVIAFMAQSRVIGKILDQLKKRKGRKRAPPRSSTQPVSVSL